MFKRAICMILCLVMLCGMIPMGAQAAETQEEAVHITGNIDLTGVIVTTKTLSTPNIKSAPGGVLYNDFYITVDGVQYRPGDKLPDTVTAGQTVSYRIIFNRLGGYCYDHKGDTGRTYVGKVTVNGQEQAAYVSEDQCELKVMGRIVLNSADITTAQQFVGPALPVQGASTAASGSFTHTGLIVDECNFAYKEGNQYLPYPDATFDTSYNAKGVYLRVLFHVDPLFNSTGFINLLTWQGIGVYAYNTNYNKTQYEIYFPCTIADKPGYLSKIVITDIDEPVHGATPDRTGTASQGVEITKIQYVICSDRSKEFMGPFDAKKHVGDDRIQLGIELRPLDGYYFDAYTQIECNGMLPSYYVVRDGGKVIFAYDLVVEDVFVNPFTDVESDDYFYDAVAWAVTSGVTSGTSATKFSPKSNCTRAQAVTFLWRAAGEPAVDGLTNPFVDVDEDDYFYNAVLWAVDRGITTGTSATKFSPKKECTRAQIVTFIHRLADGGPANNTANPFTDVDSDDYYYDAVLWAVENGITTGASATTFAPKKECTRAQIVTFLQRWINQGDLNVMCSPDDYQMMHSQEDAFFSVTVKGSGAPFTYEWHVCLDGVDTTYTYKTSATTCTFAHEFNDYMLGDYRQIEIWCIVRNTEGRAVATNIATVLPKP